LTELLARASLDALIACASLELVALIARLALSELTVLF
jgi:hypothetical protein